MRELMLGNIAWKSHVSASLREVIGALARDYLHCTVGLQSGPTTIQSEEGCCYDSPQGHQQTQN
jgi:hypothetical protein